MVEERGGLSRGILNNPDLRPQTDTKTKFADVKGVDEAKVGSFHLTNPSTGAVGADVLGAETRPPARGEAQGGQ